MNAVNLIPADGRKRRSTSISASPLTLGLFAVLVAVLAGAVLYVTTLNNVNSRQSELTSVNASVTSWQAAANSFASVVATAQARTQQLGSVRQLADTRFPWSQLLSQIAGLMPAKSALSSLQATTASGDPASAGSTAPTTTSTTAASQPGVQLSGCAASQSTVAATMVALHRVSGVSAVTLASSDDSAASGSSGSSSGSGGGGCPFPVQFQVSLVLAPSSAPASSTATGATTAAATAAASTATPTSSPASTSTGAAQ